MSTKTNRLQRGAGVVVVLMAAAAAGMLWFAVHLTDPEAIRPAKEGAVFGVWQVLYDTQAPSTQLLVAAVALALLLAAGVALAESRITKRYRRSENSGETPLAPKLVMARTAGRYDGPVTVTVLIPAHDEEDRIVATLASLQEQTRRPDRVVVVADNCTDATEELARAAGVEVFSTVENRHKKAGGLNQALASLLPDLGENDTVMVMDADTVIGREYLETATRRMTEDRALMAIGGLFMGEDGHGLIGQFQRNEYIRYSRDIKRRRGRLFVLTGTASVFRSAALREVAAQRGRLLPGVPGDVYDTVALTEDNELTLALKSLGALMTSPAQCTVVTEVMPTWRAIWHQRLRWQRGALENLGAYGLTPQTSRYWVQQFGIGYGSVALFAYYAAIFTMAMSLDDWVWFPFWLGVGGLFMVERVVTAWRGGWGARLVALTLFPELAYATFLNVVFLKGVSDILLGRQAQWSHVTRSADGKVVVREGEHV